MSSPPGPRSIDFGVTVIPPMLTESYSFNTNWPLVGTPRRQSVPAPRLLVFSRFKGPYKSNLMGFNCPAARIGKPSKLTALYQSLRRV